MLIQEIIGCVSRGTADPGRNSSLEPGLIPVFMENSPIAIQNNPSNSTGTLAANRGNDLGKEARPVRYLAVRGWGAHGRTVA